MFRSSLISFVFVAIGFPCFGWGGLAKSPGQTRQNPNFKIFFEALYSTNNSQVLIKKLPLSGEFRADLLDHLKKSKKATYQVRKISAQVFEVQMSRGQWARMELGVPGGLKVGKSQVQWDPTRSNKENMAALAKVINREYPGKTAYWSLLPQAHAVEVYDPDTVAIGAVGAALAGSWDVDQFLDGAEHFCDTGSLPTNMSIGYLLNGNLTNQRNPYQDREWVRRRFFESRNHFTNQTNWEYVFGGNARYANAAFERFYKVQDCFLKKYRYINQTEIRQHPQHEIPSGYTPVSQ